jgi:hypothetical protein
MNSLDRFYVRMRLSKQNGSTPAGTWCVLSDKGRSTWTRRTAARKMREVSRDPKFTDHYDAFEIVAN